MFTVIACFFTSMVVTFVSIPLIINFAMKKHFYDAPGERKVHLRHIPTLGGVGIFVSLVISLTIWSSEIEFKELRLFFIPVFILFLSGLKDDLHNLSYRHKLLLQFCASLILVYFGQVKISSFFGLFGIGDINLSLSYAFSTFVIIVIINSYNLIDGLDGLAASLSLLATLVLGGWFFLSNHLEYTLLSISTAGALVGFIFFNKNPAKIFMGDTGSLILGSIISILTIRFIEINRSLPSHALYKIQNAPIVGISILIVPLVDTARVFIVRLISGKSPFKPDRNHIHHVLIDIGMSHTQAVMVLLSYNMTIILISFLLSNTPGESSLIIILVLSLMALGRLKHTKMYKMQKQVVTAF